MTRTAQIAGIVLIASSLGAVVTPYVVSGHPRTWALVDIGFIGVAIVASGIIGVERFRWMRRTGERPTGWHFAFWIAVAVGLVVLFNLFPGHG